MSVLKDMSQQQKMSLIGLNLNLNYLKFIKITKFIDMELNITFNIILTNKL